jgi:hypothetical protein
MAFRTLHSSEHFEIAADDARRRVRIVRTAVRFESREALSRAFEQADEALRGVQGWALLLDSRDAPARNDETFEELFEAARRRLTARFDGVAVLVKSAEGRLQVARYSREDRVPSAIFDDEAAATAFLDEHQKG